MRSSGLKFTEACLRVVVVVMERVHRYRYVSKVKSARGADGLDVENKGERGQSRMSPLD